MSRLTQHLDSRDLCRSAGLMLELEEDRTKVTRSHDCQTLLPKHLGWMLCSKAQTRVHNSDGVWTLPKLPRSMWGPGIRLPAENRKIEQRKKRERMSLHLPLIYGAISPNIPLGSILHITLLPHRPAAAPNASSCVGELSSRPLASLGQPRRAPGR